LTTSSNTIAGSSLVWRNIIGSNNLFLLIQHSSLRIELIYFPRNLCLLSSYLVKILLLNSLLFNSLFLLLEFKSNFFLLDFL
jgi:hypothetical protein